MNNRSSEILFAGHFLESIGFEAFGDFLKLDLAMYSTSRALDDDAAATDDENDTDDEDLHQNRGGSKSSSSSSSSQRDPMLVSTTPRLPNGTASSKPVPELPSSALASSNSNSSLSASAAPSAVVRVRAPSIETLGAMRRLVEERAAQMRRRWTEVVRLPVPLSGRL
jgi:hypothetical protein